jgi:acid ceramidase
MKVDLRRPPRERWPLSDAQTWQARELMAFYESDLGLPPALVAQAARPFIRDAHWQEMESIAERAQVTVERVACGNLHYDALKAVLWGCSAFAVDTPEGPLHARNLDWPTQHGALARNTLLANFTGAPAGDFTTVGWPGFVAALSAIAPGRFAVTLNAAISTEPLTAATPVVFLLRQVLEEAPDFAKALELLRGSPIASDALLLLTGVHAGEMAVIERSPTRAAVRGPERGVIAVTNDYRVLPAGAQDDSLLAATSCARYDRIHEQLAAHRPATLRDCLRILDHPGVRMGITVQRMAFRAATGERA